MLGAGWFRHASSSDEGGAGRVTLPPHEKLSAMTISDWLLLAAQWSEGEATSAHSSAVVCREVYGPDKVGPQMMERAEAHFSLANMLMTVRRDCMSSRPRPESAAFGRLLAAAFKGAWLVPKTQGNGL